MSKSLGLALGSGGARGVAHIGVLAALEEEGIIPDYIAGCSMGAVVGGCYAAGMSLDKIRDIALKLKPRNILDIGPSFFSRMSILRTNKVKNLLTYYLGDIKLENMQIPFKCVATDLYSGELYVFEKGSAAAAVQASSTIPGVFAPVKKQGMFLVDGGCLCRVPVKVVKEMGAEVVVGVDVLANTSEPVEEITNIVSLLLRVFDLMDAQQTELRNRLDNALCDLYLRPEMKGMSQYQIKDLEKAYKEGYKLGKANVQKIKELTQD